MTTITSVAAALHFKSPSAARDVETGMPEWKKMELSRIQKMQENIARQKADRLYVEHKGNI